MKVFEVISEYCSPGSDEIITQRQYVTSDDDSILSVLKRFAAESESLGSELKSVREFLTVSHRIRHD